MKHILTALMICFVFSLNAKDTLSLSEAVSIALEKNYGIKVAKNNIEISKNNATKGNAGLLPSVNATGGTSYSNNNTRLRFAGGIPDVNRSGVSSSNINGSVGVNYILFNGLGTIYNYKSLVALSMYTEAEARAAIENTILLIASTYYNIVRSHENFLITSEALRISNERLRREELRRQYGAAVAVDILNAQVDRNADSVNMVNALLNYQNSKRELNFLLGRDVSQDFHIEKEISFREDLNYETLKTQSLNQNSEVISARYNNEVSELNYKIARSAYYPVISLSASYGYNRNQTQAGLLLLNQTNGFTGGATLSWNIFNGNRQNIRVQNAKIGVENSKMVYEEALLRIEKDLTNAWNTYQNALYILRIERENLKTAQANFERMRDLYQSGQINNTQFREAQLNLMRSENSITNASFTAKLAELELLQLSGEILK
jgi:outer membrane protein TolC